MNKLSGYLDASGKQETVGDKILVVAASLATPFYWQEFSKEWDKFLDNKGFPIAKNHSKPTFHATEFHHGNYPFREAFGWDDDRKSELYTGLVELIKKRTEYSIATAVDLDDYRRFGKAYPASKEMWTNAGAFATGMCFWKCREWASVRNYQETIPYVYDRGDTFAKDVKAEYDALCEDPEKAKWWFFKAGGLTHGNKEDYVPLQSVDLVAWEVARHYKDAAALSDVSEFESRRALIELSSMNAEYKVYGYEDFVAFWCDHSDEMVEMLKTDMMQRGVIQDELEFDEAYARKIVAIPVEELRQNDGTDNG